MSVDCPARPEPQASTHAAVRRFCEANPGAVLRSALGTLATGGNPVLALVVETGGSTYASAGALALFGDGPHAGWISGGCLEPEIARVAAEAAASGRLEWLDIDTTDDAALFAGSAVGCRGRQLLALLPLAALPDIADALRAWLDGGHALDVTLDARGHVACRIGGRARSWDLPVGETPDTGTSQWTLCLHRAPEALVLGAGPETPALIPLLESLGWRITVSERRARWREAAAAQCGLIDAPPEDAVAAHPHADVALVMHHSFEADREALLALAASRIPFIGLLGPERRRQDLFKLLPTHACDALAGRLHAPVGVPHCGRGPEAIALSITTQLQQWRGAQRT